MSIYAAVRTIVSFINTWLEEIGEEMIHKEVLRGIVAEGIAGSINLGGISSKVYVCSGYYLAVSVMEDVTIVQLVAVDEEGECWGSPFLYLK